MSKCKLALMYIALLPCSNSGRASHAEEQAFITQKWLPKLKIWAETQLRVSKQLINHLPSDLTKPVPERSSAHLKRIEQSQHLMMQEMTSLCQHAERVLKTTPVHKAVCEQINLALKMK